MAKKKDFDRQVKLVSKTTGALYGEARWVMGRKFNIAKVLVISPTECLSCGKASKWFTTMWANLALSDRGDLFCKQCGYDKDEARELYMQYVVGPKPNARPPAQRPISTKHEPS